MRTSARLGLYGAILLAVFAVAFATAGAVIPEETVQSWTEEGNGHADDHAGDDHAGGEDMTTEDMSTGEHGGRGASVTGLALELDGFRLDGVSAPTGIGTEGELALTVQGRDGQPVTDFEFSHEKELHLIVVRTDGSGFRHVHPEHDGDGRWSIPWEWDRAGSYRLYAEFVPSDIGESVTLSSVVQVAGDFAPQAAAGPVTTAQTNENDFEVSVQGELTAGESSMLTVSVARDGQPVTELEPYLGAYGHLVALRDGDLAYLHVHPLGEELQAGETSGPEVVFEVTTPTPGRYLLYLDFQVDAQVYTAEFVLDTGPGSPTSGDDSAINDGAVPHDETEPHDGAEHQEGDSHDHSE